MTSSESSHEVRKEMNRIITTLLIVTALAIVSGTIFYGRGRIPDLSASEISREQNNTVENKGNLPETRLNCDFGFPDESGKRLIISRRQADLKYTEKFTKALGPNGRLYSVSFSACQKMSDKSTGRDTSRNFHNLRGNVFSVKNSAIKTRTGANKYYDTCLTGTEEFFSTRKVLMPTPLRKGPMDVKIIKKIEKERDRKISATWGLVRFDSGEKIYLVLFERQGDDALASLAVLTPQKAVYNDYPAKYSRDSLSVWRVSDNGEMNPDAFVIPYGFRTKSGIEFIVSWYSEEYEDISLMHENGDRLEYLQKGGRYIMPQ
ncbi:MAG: hypothetical protein AB9903_01190 [Vulcanimicrobiota bacterium]